MDERAKELEQVVEKLNELLDQQDCESCGQRDGTWRVDGYMHDVHERLELVCLCDSCEHEQLMDI